MYSAMLFSFLYFIVCCIGVAFAVCLIVFLFRFLALKQEQNQLFREYILFLKEKKQCGD